MQSKLGALGGCHAVLLQSDCHQYWRQDRPLSLLLVLAPTLYMYLPWTWPPFPYLRTQKATTPFALPTWTTTY